MWHLDKLHGASRQLWPSAGALPGVPVEAAFALPEHGRGPHTLVVAAAVLGVGRHNGHLNRAVKEVT